MIYIYGASGHGGMILEMIENQGLDVSFYDDDSSKSEYLEVPVVQELNGNEKIVVGVGDNSIREGIVDSLEGATFISVIDITAKISPRVKIDVGTVIFAGVIVNHTSSIGKHTILNTRASVDHDCTIGNFVHICPGAVLCGGVYVGDNSLIGAGAIILPNVHIGKNVKIGAGSVVRNDIEDGFTAVGVPANII